MSDPDLASAISHLADSLQELSLALRPDNPPSGSSDGWELVSPELPVEPGSRAAPGPLGPHHSSLSAGQLIALRLTLLLSLLIASALAKVLWVQGQRLRRVHLVLLGLLDFGPGWSLTTECPPPGHRSAYLLSAKVLRGLALPRACLPYPLLLGSALQTGRGLP